MYDISVLVKVGYFENINSSGSLQNSVSNKIFLNLTDVKCTVNINNQDTFLIKISVINFWFDLNCPDEAPWPVP